MDYSSKLSRSIQRRRRSNLIIVAAFIAATLFSWADAALSAVYLATIQLSVAVRNARLDAIETTMGTAVIVEFRSGTQPADCATAASGTLLAQSIMPSDWMAAASGGSKAKLGVWTITGLATGTIGYFRIYESGSPSVCHMQGSVTITGGGGDMTVDNTSIASAQVATVNTFTLTDNNA